MEMVLFALALVLAALGALAALRHHRVTAWDRELDSAFGERASRDFASHRSL